MLSFCLWHRACRRHFYIENSVVVWPSHLRDKSLQTADASSRLQICRCEEKVIVSESSERAIYQVRRVKAQVLAVSCDCPMWSQVQARAALSLQCCFFVFMRFTQSQFTSLPLAVLFIDDCSSGLDGWRVLFLLCWWFSSAPFWTRSPTLRFDVQSHQPPKAPTLNLRFFQNKTMTRAKCAQLMWQPYARWTVVGFGFDTTHVMRVRLTDVAEQLTVSQLLLCATFFSFRVSSVRLRASNHW